jgi:hypothetical protein
VDRATGMAVKAGVAVMAGAGAAAGEVVQPSYGQLKLLRLLWPEQLLGQMWLVWVCPLVDAIETKPVASIGAAPNMASESKCN